MKYEIGGLTAFLKRSVSTFHAVEAICEELRGAGYVQLRESQRWELAPGRGYFVTRNQSSVIAFRVPERGFAPIQAVACHSDSPTFRVKECAELEAQGSYVQLNTEGYGGMIMSTWMDRPLSVAGRVLARTERGIESKLVKVDRDMLVIPSLPIHMNRSVNDGVKFNPQVDTLPLLGDIGAKGSFMRIIADAAGVAQEQIAGSDLFLYNRMDASVWGEDGCYISAPRLDDLECAYTGLCALLGAKGGDHINMLCVFDNEEVGSLTRQGGDSTFFEDMVQRLALALGADGEALRGALASSFLISADNAHALHPSHPEKYDPTNRVYMNGGVVVKFSANQRYTTDGLSKAIFSQICGRAGVPVQFFANRSDMAGGSTLGNISSAHVSIPAVDVGLAQLAMHSCFETAGTKDAEYMAKALQAYYETEIRAEGDGIYEL